MKLAEFNISAKTTPLGVACNVEVNGTQDDLVEMLAQAVKANRHLAGIMCEALDIAAKSVFTVHRPAVPKGAA